MVGLRAFVHAWWMERAGFLNLSVPKGERRSRRTDHLLCLSKNFTAGESFQSIFTITIFLHSSSPRGLGHFVAKIKNRQWQKQTDRQDTVASHFTLRDRDRQFALSLSHGHGSDTYSFPCFPSFFISDKVFLHCSVAAGWTPPPSKAERENNKKTENQKKISFLS